MAVSKMSLPKMNACHAFCAVVTALIIALTFCSLAFLSIGSAYAASSFAYDGDDVAFIAADGSQLDSYSRQDGTSVQYQYQGDSIAVDYVTSAVRDERGFYFNADIADDEEVWNEGLFIQRDKNGRIAYEFDSSYAGKAWPIVPYNAQDSSAGTETQYYLAIPPLEKIPGYLLTVTFTDGLGNNIDVQTVVSGNDAVPPANLIHNGLIFQGWDQPFTSIVEDMVINAVWVIDQNASHTVTFEDGWGAVLKTETVMGGEAVAPPEDPKHGGYTFTGWSTDAFGCVTEDLVVVAQWISDDELALATARAAIADLPDPTTVVGKTDNEAVAAAVAAYSALSDGLKSQLTDDERMRLAKCAIAVLPKDPYDVEAEHEPAIAFAQSLYDSLSNDQRANLDAVGSFVYSSTTFGRYLQNNVWAFDSLTPIVNTTTLSPGTYTGQVKSEFNMGKNTSPIRSTLKVLSVTVKDGVATALIEHTASLSESLKVGDTVYERIQTDASKYACYRIPVKLNSMFHFSVRSGGAEDNPAITYEMTVSADESSMTPDPEKSEGATGDSGSDGSNNAGKSGGTGGSSTGSRTSSPTSGSKLTATGANRNANSNTSAARLTATRNSSAGSLSSLLRPSTSSKSANSAKSKSSSNTASSKTDSSKTGSADGASVSEVELVESPESAAAFVGTDLRPAVAGGCMLFVSLGLLAFVLRFIKRESILG